AKAAPLSGGAACSSADRNLHLFRRGLLTGGRQACAGRRKRVAHRDDIQGLRAVAVLLVVLDHAGVPYLRGGYVGVDVFFVLSGFLITGFLLAEAERRGSVSLAGFYARRARRILPAAVLTLLVTAGAGAASLAWSIETGSAYFSTVARAWELALGAALAVALPSLPPLARWVGLAAIGVAAVGFSSATPFPGYAAILPAAGAALVIA